MNKEINKANRLGEAPIGKLLLEFSIPAIIAMLANALYNVVDSIFVGQGVGPLALTAVTIALPIMFLLMAFGMLIGIGSTAMVSIRLGQGNKHEAEKILGNAVSAICILGIALPCIMLLFLDNILIALGATTPEVFNYAKQFTTIILTGSIFQFFSFGINNIIRAEGNPIISMGTMLFSSALNTILNPIFIFVLHWGIRGSALATVTTQIIVTGYILYHFTRGRGILKIRRENLKIQWSIMIKIFAIGLSPFLLQVAASVTFFLFNNSLMVYGGTMAVAAMGVMSRTTMMILMPIFGINQGVQPIIGFNYGAHKYDRVKKALMLAATAATSICVFGFLIVQIFSHTIISIFNSNPELLKIGTNGIKIYLAMLPIIGLQIIITNYFQATGKASKAILLSLTRQVIFLIPLILVLPIFFKLNGIWLAGPLSDFFASLLAIILFMKELKLLNAKHELSAESC